MHPNEPHDGSASSSTEVPSAPVPIEPDSQWEHYALYNKRVREALYALPSFFKSELVITGVLATDLHSFNSSLGATIEAQVAGALNELRDTWDPDQKYATYRFVRQPQTFPDVTLRTATPGETHPPLMGIELKGWYTLAKEREPSFRYKVTPAVCSPADLLAVFPWALSNVIAGSPLLFAPYVESARYAAIYRNWHWQYKKGGVGDNRISVSNASAFYPSKADPISDEPHSDKGGNFGRFARTGLMDEYRSLLFRQELSGIPLLAWQRFLSIFSEEQPEERILRALDQMTIEASRGKPRLAPETIERIKAAITEIAYLLGTK